MQVGQEAVVCWFAFLIITLAHVWASQLVPGVKTQLTNAGDGRNEGLIPGSGRAPEEGCGNTPVFFLGEFHGQRSQVGYSP